MTRRSRQSGGAALTVMLVMTSIAAMIGALAIRGAIADLRVAGADRNAKRGFYCAEGGLAAARGFFGANYPSWNGIFSGSAVPSGYPVSGDLDGDGTIDFQVTLQDNYDEFPPLTNDTTRDNDRTAVMVSNCVSPAMAPHQVQEIVVFNGGGTNYRAQAGKGSNHAGNAN